MTTRLEVSRAFQYALVIFTLTVLIGLANATKVFGAIDRDTLLTHLHSGTLGWITMGVIAVTIWIFGGAGRGLGTAVMLSALVTAAYVMAFWSGNFVLRAVFGMAELAVIVYWWWWAFSAARIEGFGHLDIPKLSIVLGLTTLVVGSTVGVLLQLLFLTGNVTPDTGALIGTHASAQIGGYLVLVAAGIAEWQLAGGGSRSRAGLAQAWSLFGGGILLAIGVTFGLQPLLGLATLLQVVGIVFVIARFGRRVIAAPWMAATGTRHIAVAVGFLVVGLVLEILLVQAFTAARGDQSAVSPGLNTALSHAMFVGLMTNILFGCILVLTAGQPRVWPWADDVIFWGLNLGALSFIVVLLVVGSSAGAGVFAHPVAFTAPIMGLAALLGIATYFVRLGGARAAAVLPAEA
ncbi:MAG TPA: hypothetical protein VGQ86_08445 [Candidatus Limnocylindria bacterium]|nr:hypothetical protein [Candidatus Limnocylindria bacterium]